MKKLFYFSVAVLLSIILFWFGSKFLFHPTDNLNTSQMWTAGMLLIIGGVLAVGSSVGDWRVVSVLAALGIYFCARGAGTINLPWLTRSIGVAAWLGALLLLYITWPGRPAKPIKDDDAFTD